MKVKINNLDRVSDPKTIKEKEIVPKTVSVVNVNQTYLTIGEKEDFLKHCFTIIIEDMAKRFKECIKEVLEECFEEHPACYARFFILHYIQNETKNGNMLFLNYCTENKLYILTSIRITHK